MIPMDTPVLNQDRAWSEPARIPWESLRQDRQVTRRQILSNFLHGFPTHGKCSPGLIKQSATDQTDHEKADQPSEKMAAEIWLIFPIIWLHLEWIFMNFPRQQPPAMLADAKRREWGNNHDYQPSSHSPYSLRLAPMSL